MKTVMVGSTDHVFPVECKKVIHLPIRLKDIEAYLLGKHLGQIDKNSKKIILKEARNLLIAEVKDILIHNDSNLLGIVAPKTFWGEEPGDKKRWYKAAEKIFSYLGENVHEIICYSNGVPSKFLEKIPEVKITYHA